MSDPSRNPFDALLDAFRQVVREEIALVLSNGADHPAAEKERLLTPERGCAFDRRGQEVALPPQKCSCL